MLILTRRISESIIIYEEGNQKIDDIFLSVLGIKGNQVRIGIQASDKWKIHRQEIYDKILEENK